MAKIQMSTVKREANFQVIELNSYLISKVIKAQVVLEAAINKQERTKWNDNTQKSEKVLPILTELVEAFEAE